MSTQREIKFRVWDGKEMREPPPLNEWDMEDGEFWVSYCDNPIMQYTGLRDKNGREIYEGDVMEITAMIDTDMPWEDGDDKGVLEQTITVLVEWLDMGFNFRTIKKAKYLSGWCHDSDDGQEYSVIGNVHEHPELIP